MIAGAYCCCCRRSENRTEKGTDTESVKQKMRNDRRSPSRDRSLSRDVVRNRNQTVNPEQQTPVAKGGWQAAAAAEEVRSPAKPISLVEQ